jgi:hypothetical protein
MIIKVTQKERSELLRAWGSGCIDTGKLPSIEPYMINDALLPPVDIGRIDKAYNVIRKQELIDYLKERKGEFEPGIFERIVSIIKRPEPKD